MTLRRSALSRLTRWSDSPATILYVLTLVATTLLLTALGTEAAENVLQSQSTNLANLGSDPLRVLVSSAFWLADPSQLLLVAAALPLLAGAEARLGTRRWVGLFAAGHVGATLLVAAGLLAAGAFGAVSLDTVEDVVDVGFSYGACAVIGAATLSMAAGSQRLTLTVLFAAIGADTLLGADLATSAGHALAVLIGLAGAVWLAARPAPHAVTEQRTARAGTIASCVTRAGWSGRSVRPPSAGSSTTSVARGSHSTSMMSTTPTGGSSGS